MNWINVLGLSLGLAMDAFAVAIAAGVSLARVTPRHVFRLAFHFGLFQFLMPVVGWLVGSQVAHWIQAFDHWVAFALLAWVGGKMLWEGCAGQEERSVSDPTRGLTLVTLSVATSIDALAVGLSLALLGVDVWGPSVVIGVITATLTAVGISFGNRWGRRWGRAAEILGGCVLLLIGVKIVVSHLFA